jgi:hypothetical protein
LGWMLRSMTLMLGVLGCAVAVPDAAPTCAS